MNIENFGLGLILSFTDNASSGIDNAANSLLRLTGIASQSAQQLNTLTDITALSNLSMMTGRIGDAFLSVGSKVTGLFTSLLQNVMNTGSEFEAFRITLNALYRDSDEVDRLINKLMAFSAKTPFEVGDVKELLVVLKSQGINAFDTIGSSLSDTRQETLAWIGDLMAFKPDVTAARWRLAFNNFLGSNQPKVLENILDMGKIETILGRETGDTPEERLQDLVDLIAMKNLDGLMSSLMGTWTQVISNMSDVFTRFILEIAEAGVFDDLKAALVSITSAIAEILDKGKLPEFAKVIADSLSFITKPLITIGKSIGNIIRWITNLVTTRPKLAKFIIQMTALSGVLLTLIGVGLKFVSSLSGIATVLLLFQRSAAPLSLVLSNGFRAIVSALGPLAIIVGALYAAWKTDFGGLRTIVTSFASNVISSFKIAKDSVNMNVSDMMSKVTELKNKGGFFSELTLGFMKLLVVCQALSELWHSKDGFTISEDTFLKAKELGVLPLIEAILDLKYRFGLFKDGFIAGFKEVSDKLNTFIQRLQSTLDGTFIDRFLKKITKVLKLFSSGDAKAWYKFGENFGKFTANILAFFGAFTVVANIVVRVVRLANAFYRVYTAVSSIVSELANLFSYISSLGNTSGVLTTALGGLSASAVAAITAAVIALISVVVYAKNHWEDFKTKVISVWNTLKTEAERIWGALRTGFISITDNIKSSVSGLSKPFNDLKQKFIELCQAVGESQFFADLVDLLDQVGKIIVDIVIPALNGLIRILSTTLQSVWDVIVTTFNSIVTFISDTLEGLITIVEGILDILIGIFTLDFDKIKLGISEVFSGIFTIINSALLGISNITESILRGILNIVGSILTELYNVIYETLRSIWDTIVHEFDRIKERMISVWNSIFGSISLSDNSIATSISDTLSSVKQKIESILKYLADKFSPALQTAAKVFTDTKTAITDAWDSTVEFFTNIFNGIVDTFNHVKTRISEFVDSIKSGLKSMKDKVLEYLNPAIDTFNELRDTVKEFRDFMRDKFGTIYESFVKPVIDKMIEGFNYLMGVVAKLKEFLETLGTIFDHVYKVISPILNGIHTLFSDVYEDVEPILTRISNIVSTTFTKIYQTVLKVLTEVFNTVKKIFTDIFDTIFNVLTRVWNNIVQTFNNVVDFIGGILLDIWNAISNTLMGILNLIMGKNKEAKANFSTVWSSIQDIPVRALTFVKSQVKTLLSGIADVIRTILRGISSVVSDIVDGIKRVVLTVVSSVISAVRENIAKVKGLMNDCKNAVKLALQAIKNFVLDAFNYAKNIVTSKGSSIKTTISNIGSTIKSTVSNVISGIKSLIMNNGIVKAITDKMTKAKNVVTEAVKSLKSKFNFSWSLPSIKLPHFKISGGFSLNPPKVPSFSVNWYKTGGIFDKPSVIGVGENGKEAVMPLENNTQWISQLAAKLSGLLNPKTPYNDGGGISIKPDVIASTPTPTSNNVSNQNTRNTYATTNNNQSTNKTQKVDNSITFNSGSIVINVAKATEAEADKFANLIIEKIRRKQQLDNMTHYRGLNNPSESFA